MRSIKPRVETGEITISLPNSLSQILKSISEPGIIANIWGRSGSGKTILALNLALDRILAGKKVLYFTDQLEGIGYKIQEILKRDDLQGGFKEKLDSFLKIVNLKNFKNQIEIIHELFTIFPSREEITKSKEFKQFMEIEALDLDVKVINSLKEFEMPSMIIFDEFARQYRELSLTSDASVLSKLIGVQLGFLKKLAKNQSIPVILLNGTHTIKVKPIEDDDSISYQEAPLVHYALEYWEDVNVRLSHTMNAGERILTFSDHRKGDVQIVEKMQLKGLFERLLTI
ncbi:MAG: hypothetical protein ACFFCS_06180 [Candidatus Hodarchaeota archaeon]